MIRKIAEELSIGDSFAQKMGEILSDSKHQKLFKKAETVCKCDKECDCDNDKCSCKGNCIISCASCGKDKTVEAANKVIQDLINVSATLDDFGFEKQSLGILRIAKIYSKKLASKDSNDVRMSDLRHDSDILTEDLSDEISELEIDPEHGLFERDPELFKSLNLRKKQKSVEDDELERYLADSELDELNADDHDLLTFLEEDDYNLEEEDEEAMPSTELDDGPKTTKYFPETMRSPDTLREYNVDADTDIDQLLNEPISFDADLDIPESSEDYFPADKLTRSRLKNKILQNRIPQNKVPQFTEDELKWAFNKADKYFSKLAKSEDIEEDEDDDEDYEDE